MKILLVDDSHSAALAMTARLETYGHRVLRAADGLEAVELFREHGPDLVLMDLEMPRLNGFEATQRIRAEEAKAPDAWTPIIFLTASNHDASLVTAIDAGADDFICKSSPEPVLRAKMVAMARIAALRQRLCDANNRWRELADLDGLTGLANRRSLDARAPAHWRRAQSCGGPLAVLMIDIDHFKAYNDLYSHLAGDECLRKVAQALRTATGHEIWQQVLVARYGGEEFAIIIDSLAEAQVLALARRALSEVAALALPHRGNPPWGIVTISVGMAWRKGPGVGATASAGVEHLFAEADSALYRAKHAGRNQIAQHPTSPHPGL